MAEQVVAPDRSRTFVQSRCLLFGQRNLSPRRVFCYHVFCWATPQAARLHSSRLRPVNSGVRAHPETQHAYHAIMRNHFQVCPLQQQQDAHYARRNPLKRRQTRVSYRAAVRFLDIHESHSGTAGAMVSCNPSASQPLRAIPSIITESPAL